MNRPFACLILACALATVSRDAPNARSQAPDRIADALKKIDAATADVVPALVIAVTNRTQTLGVIAHGYTDIKKRTPATVGSPFPIGSIAKSFTAMALMQLMDEGRFDPHAPIATYLPWFKVHSSPAPITGHHLLTHTAGLMNYRADLASAEYATYSLREYDVPYAPGSHYWYSNLGFQTLGYTLEHMEHAPWHAIIKQRVFDRVGMRSSAGIIDDAARVHLPVSYDYWPGIDEPFEQPWFEYNAGDGSIVSTGGDMADYVRMILNRGGLPNGRLVSERAFVMMTTPFKENYGYGLRIRSLDGDTVVGHNGAIAGFNSVMEAHMNDGYGVVLLTNGRPSRELGLWILAAVKAAMRNEPLADPPAARPAEPTRPRPGRDSVVPPEYRAFVGRYKNNAPEDTVFEIFLHDGHLTAAHHLGDEGDALVRLGPGLFKPAAPDFNPERYRFDTIVDGVALRMTFSGMPTYRVGTSDAVR